MQHNLSDAAGLNITFQAGNLERLKEMRRVSAKKPFEGNTICFLNQVSKLLMSNPVAREYPDVITYAFWIRRAYVEQMKKRFLSAAKKMYRLGRGTVFHISPSNVPVNYAYSLAVGLLCGNANAVRLPSKEFPQIDIINKAICAALEMYSGMKPYIALFRYGHDREINEMLSAMADARVIWGGDNTIHELRKAPLKARATEIVFADRYSLAVIDSETYMETGDKERLATGFYNDTYLTDQNACTSPRLVVWTGNRTEEAKKLFWKNLHTVVKEKYELQGAQAVSKLASGFLLAAERPDVKRIVSEDNLIARVHVEKLTADLMDFKDNSGYFFEYDCKDIFELKAVCDDDRCQTIAYMGDPKMFDALLAGGVRGIDRIVPVGRTMDFDWIWDGYDLFERLTRAVVYL